MQHNSPLPEKEAGLLQGWVLVSLAWLAVMANIVLAPILPLMKAHFSHLESVDLLISLAATLPALFVALFAIPAGILADRIGRKTLLLLSVAFYGVAGTAPLWLGTLPQIIVSRAFVGLMEAVLMTVGTAMIGDYFSGTRRERFLAAQTGSSTIAASILLLASGLLGSLGWRYPYAIYGFAFFLIPMVGFYLWEPQIKASTGSAANPREAGPHKPFSFSGFIAEWWQLGGICLITVFGMTAFLITVIQLPFLLTERGMASPAFIGKCATVATLATVLGAILFTILTWRILVKLAASLFLLGIGFAFMGLSTTWYVATFGATVANLGAGIILPTLITWALSTLAPQKRGKGTGAWQAASFLGQFLSPLAVLGLNRLTGSLSAAIAVYAVACGLLGGIVLISSLKTARQPEAQEG
ncbi:MAG: MFS transporter [Desulfobacteraceae bacterium]